MRVGVLRLQHFRNYTAAEFRPAPTTTIVVGENGSGKSSLLEAAGLFSTLSSPRASSLKMVVSEGMEEAGTKLTTSEGTELEVRLKGGRTMLRIGGNTAQPRDFLGRFRSVLFTPEDLDLVRGEPALRRRALDDLLVQMRPMYRATRSDFERALKQRNAALRDGLETEARLYGEPLARLAAEVLESRRAVAVRRARRARDVELAVPRYRGSRRHRRGCVGGALHARLRRRPVPGHGTRTDARRSAP
jgi:DNA replication and repair protein RecF